MLLVYNESSTPWAVKTLKSGNSCIYTPRDIIDKKTNNKTHCELLIASRGHMDVSNDVLSSKVNMGTADIINVEAVDNIKLGVTFQAKDCSPALLINPKFTRDVLLITLQLNGSIVTDVDSMNSAVLANMIVTGGELAMIASLGDVQKETKLEIELQDSKHNRTRLYSFVRHQGSRNVELVIITVVSEEHVSKPKCKIRNFRPSKPTELVIVHKNDFAAMKRSGFIDDKHHTILQYSTKSDLHEQILDKTTKGYTAITLYVDTDNIHSAAFDIYKDTSELLTQKFNVFNMLLSNGKIVKR